MIYHPPINDLPKIILQITMIIEQNHYQRIIVLKPLLIVNLFRILLMTHINFLPFLPIEWRQLQMDELSRNDITIEVTL